LDGASRLVSFYTAPVIRRLPRDLDDYAYGSSTAYYAGLPNRSGGTCGGVVSCGYLGGTATQNKKGNS
jgi:hypothetical protein